LMKMPNLFKKITIAATGLWLTVFALIPFLLICTVSFMTRSETALIVPQLSFEGYGDILAPAFLRIFWNSMLLAGTTALVCLATGYPFAYVLARLGARGKNLLLMLVIIPFWTNSLIRSYALVFILKTNGLLNQVLMASGLIDHPVRMLYSDLAVLIGLVYTLVPFMILPIYASVEKLDPQLIEVAQDLGAGKIRTFLHVALPLTMPGIVAGITLVFLPALGMFYIPDILGGAKSLLIGNFIKNQFMTARNWPAGAAASILLTLIMIVLIAVYQRSVAKAQKSITVAV
jgi:spermidine/putrescine transport system permease protein